MASTPTPIFDVSSFIALVNQTLEYAYPTVEIRGEVASFKVNQGKWVFFDLKDATGSVGCFMSLFSLRMPITDGMTVVVRAVPKLTNWGKFSVTVQSIRPEGEGNLKKSFELLRAKLDAEGLFAPERKRPLPRMPSRIAVISSTQAAGYADFIKIINERWGGMAVDVAHVQVQGEGAAEQIVRAITYINQREVLPEVLVIIRGGGSADDLSVFNDEPLVRAIAASRIPTLVGVGHEVDETLADMVADVRAATPSNAAQIVVPDRREIISSVRHMTLRMASRMESAVTQLDQQRLRSLERMLHTIDTRLAEQLVWLDSTRMTLRAYDPSAVLARGYAVLRGTVAVGQSIQIEQQQQLITAEVTDVKHRT